MRVQIHGNSHQLSETLRVHTDNQARLATGRVSPHVERLSIYLEDVNGPRGGEDKSCRLVAKLLPRGEVVVHGSGGDWESLIHATLRRLARAVIREVDRRRSQRVGRISP